MWIAPEKDDCPDRYECSAPASNSGDVGIHTLRRDSRTHEPNPDRYGYDVEADILYAEACSNCKSGSRCGVNEAIKGKSQVRHKMCAPSCTHARTHSTPKHFDPLVDHMFP